MCCDTGQARAKEHATHCRCLGSHGGGKFVMDDHRHHAKTFHRQTILALNALGQSVTASLKLDDVLHRALAEVGALLNADTTAIQLPEREKLLVSLGEPRLGQVRALSVPRDSGVASYVLRTGEAIWLRGDESNVPGLEVNHQIERLAGFTVGSLLVAPLLHGGQIIGVLEAAHRDADGLSPDDLPVLVAAANWTAIAIANAKLHEQAQEARQEQALLEERNRLARELHDAVTQSLYSITTLAGAWRRQIDAGTLQPSKEQIVELGELAHQALREVRLLIYELRPSELEEEGLVGALYRRLETVEKGAGVSTQLLVTDDSGRVYPAPQSGQAAAVGFCFYRLPKSVEHSLFRIVQEALNNALKYSGATHIRVSLEFGLNRLSVEIHDDGRGFDMSAAQGALGFGLANMRDRAEQVGGRLTIVAAPEQGTTIRIEEVPYRMIDIEEMIE